MESYWPGLFAKALEGVNVKELITNIGSGVGAVPAAGGKCSFTYFVCTCYILHPRMIWNIKIFNTLETKIIQFNNFNFYNDSFLSDKT